MDRLRLAGAKRPLHGWLAFAAALVACDQATKFAATAWLAYGVPHPVLPGFNLTLLHNTGAAFSFLHDGGGWQRWLFTAIAIGVAGVVIVWLTRIGGGQRWASCSLALILGGALGNLIDRVRLGHVVDFIQIYHGAWSFPAFNIADSAITVGACMLILRGPQPAPRRSVD